MGTEIRAIELFAGVGGFRIGLEGWNGKSASSGFKKTFETPYKVVWSNQWEPATKIQHASMVYEHRFGKQDHSNSDIAQVEIQSIPPYDLLVGGFPCQDYSVATTLKNSKGLIGKKGVLWWSIHKIIAESKTKPKYLILENVDRLLISPSGQRGRDFAIILQSLNEFGYAVEWRVINAADYGMPQRRKRVFILAYLKGTPPYDQLKEMSAADWILDEGTFATAFPVTSGTILFPSEFQLNGDIVTISNHFNKTTVSGQFENAGIMMDGSIKTMKTAPNYFGNKNVLGDIIQNGEVTPEFFIEEADLGKWIYLKGAKKETRKNIQGFEYNYSEGSMVFPDPLNKPSRTIITGEGGSSASRFKHVIQTANGFRRLAPIELERLNMFPDNHTQFQGISDTKRAFFMGNALVVGVVEKIGIALYSKIHEKIALQP